MRALGVDACRSGWVGIAYDGTSTSAVFASEIAALVAAGGRVDVVAIDIPIGLPDTGVRAADVLARLAVGPRRSSVFATPARAAIAATTYPEANEINRRLTGQGLSKQSYMLRAKILDVDHWVRQAPCPVIEVHPEVSFATLSAGHVTSRKSTWAGFADRNRLLGTAGIRLDGDLGAVGHEAAVDDVLDAAVAAWSGWRYLHGQAVPRPDPPELMPDGWPAAIWA